MSLQVKEIFRTLQGEGRFAGYPCTLVRLAGCNLRCAWCDTTSAYTGGRAYRLPRLLEKISALREELVLVTGGEPLHQTETPALLQALLDRGHRVILETNGAIDLRAVPERVVKVVDLKGPSSGEMRRNRWSNLDLLRPGDELKFVLADEKDYRWAREQIKKRRLDRLAPVNLSPVFGRLDPARLAAWMLRDRLPARLNLQLHKTIWPEGKEGVRERIPEKRR
jgi:7-carboxy-7-deazaguanine synthase